MEIWHKRIKELRENTDVTLKDMAKIIGVSEATVQRYESGKIQEIPYKVIVAYAERFNVFPSYIMGWSDNPHQYTFYDLEHNIEFESSKEKSPTIPEPNHENDRFTRYLDFLRNDDTLRKLVDVAITCTEDDLEMAIKLLKYFRIRG